MNAIVPINNPAATYSVGDVERVANAIAKGGLFGSKDPYAVLTLCLLAQAEGQHPAVVFRDYHIIQGKPAKKADAMLRDFVSAGGKVEWHQLDDGMADATFSHPGGGTVRIDWTMERAQQAGLATAMWKKYPRQMLRSRVISEGVRTVFPGATSGLYVPEEVSSFGDDASHSPQPQPTQAETQPLQIEAQPEAHGKIPGIQKIKTAIRQMKQGGNDAITLDEFEAVISHYDAEMKALEDGHHEWWTGRDRDGNEFEGIPAWLARRREELSRDDGQLAIMIESMKGCDSVASLTNWMGANEAMIDELDDPDRRKFEMARDLHESGLMAVATVTAG